MFLSRTRLIEIGHEIVRILEADRQPQRRVADAELGACLLRQPLMRRGRRMRD